MALVVVSTVATTVLVISVAAVVVVMAVVSDVVGFSDGDCSRGAGSCGGDGVGSYDV